MNKNILIVCADRDLRKDVSKLVATELKMLYLDADELLEFELPNYQDFSLNDAGEQLNKLEQENIKRVAGFKNCVITISNDMFVSGDNFKLTKNLFKVFVKIPKQRILAKNKNKHKTQQELLLYNEINNLVSINCDVTIDGENKIVNNLCQEIICKIG